MFQNGTLFLNEDQTIESKQIRREAKKRKRRERKERKGKRIKQRKFYRCCRMPPSQSITDISPFLNEDKTTGSGDKTKRKRKEKRKKNEKRTESRKNVEP